MLTTARISNYIYGLPKGRLFSTKELLVYGTRASVDQCLHRLVKAGKVIRLAYGIFMRQDSEITLASAQTLAIDKAQAFCKRMIDNESESLLALVAARRCGNQQFTFAVKGRSGTLTYCGTSIRLETQKSQIAATNSWR